MKVVVGVVLYNPNEKNVRWIRKLNKESLFSKLLVYDNSNENHENCFDNQDIVYITTLKNEGLSKPYNQMIDIALQEGADFLCLLDQDSDYEIDEIAKMIRFLELKPTEIQDSIIIAPRSYAVNSPRVTRGNYLTTVEFAINSGSFLQLELIKKAQLRYDEQIFLDGVDYEFGWQIIDAGYKTKIFEDSVLEQNLGYTLSEDDRFTHHSAFRYYLIAKNRRYIYRKHKGPVRGEVLAMLKNIYLCARILRHEDERREKLIACIKGMICRRGDNEYTSYIE